MNFERIGHATSARAGTIPGFGLIIRSLSAARENAGEAPPDGTNVRAIALGTLLVASAVSAAAIVIYYAALYVGCFCSEDEHDRSSRRRSKGDKSKRSKRAQKQEIKHRLLSLVSPSQKGKGKHMRLATSEEDAVDQWGMA